MGLIGNLIAALGTEAAILAASARRPGKIGVTNDGDLNIANEAYIVQSDGTYKRIKAGVAKRVLFSGAANAVGAYTLTDDITKYKFLLVSFGIDSGNSFRSYMLIDVSQIILGQSTQFSWTYAESSAFIMRMYFNFSANTTLQVTTTGTVGSYVSTINKITGIF